jgi:hypothetical protein
MTDSQAHTHPLGLCRKECVENSPLIFGGYSNTGVSHGNEHLIGSQPFRPYHDVSRPIGNGAHCFDAILDQIHKHLLQLDAVAGRVRQIVNQLRPERNLVFYLRPPA